MLLDLTGATQNEPGPAASDPVLTGLNPVQMEAVVHGDGPLLVLAGAGSGKTRVLTRRIVHLILRRAIPADRILAVTFTNKAAGEMRARVESMLGYDASGLWIGTFHSICLRLLRRHSDRLGFTRSITVFDQDDSAGLLKEVLREADLNDPPKVRELQEIISLAKNRMWDPEDLEAEWPRPDRHRIARLYRSYQDKLRAQGGADFDDLLMLAVRLLEQNQDLGDRYAQKFLHILVDEYQDTNHIQFRLVRRLAAEHGNILAVGDDDQSIYGWRGADLSNILEFEKRFPKAAALRMTQNYRSTGAILSVANAVVKHNRSRREKSLWTENETGARPVFFLAADEEEEARRIVMRIQRAQRAGELRLNEVAILYRVHALSRPIEEACLGFGIPYTLVGGVVFYQRREIKDLLAYLRLAVNPFDSVSFVRAVGAPGRGIGEVGLSRITAASAAHGGDLARTCAELTSESGLKGRTLEKAREFGLLLLDLAARAEEGPEPLLRTVCERTGFLEWLKESGERDWQERQANVLELLEGAARFQARVQEESLTAWLDQVALYTNLDTRAADGERITLMSVHNAKGLEYPYVFIAGLEEGLFPHFSSFDDPAELEEERRLFYVAATRAMRGLCLSASEDRRRANWMGTAGVSRFVIEIPPELLDEAQDEPRRPSGAFRARGAEPSWRRSPPAGAGRGLREPAFDADAADPILDDATDPVDPETADIGGLEIGASEPGSAAFGGRRGGAGAPDRVPQKSSRRAAGSEWKGRTVEHVLFGIGRVEQQEGTGPEARLSVVFPQVGRKKIVARFVRPI